jgi:hypothetical protein
MASKRQLKKDLNNAFGEIIETSLIWQNYNPKADSKEAEAIVDDSITAFDELNAKVNERNVENPKAHYKTINQDFNTKANALVDRLNKL